MKISTDFVIEELEDQVQGMVLATLLKNQEVTVSPDDEESGIIEFFNSEPGHSLVALFLPDAQMSGSTYDELKGNLELSDSYLDQDTLTTFLSSGELVLMTVSANAGETFGIGVVDRSSGIGMYCKKNWFDRDWLASMQAVIEWNNAMTLAGESQEKFKPINSELREVRYPGAQIPENVIQRSEARLNAFLVEMMAINYSQVYGTKIRFAQ